MKFIKRLLTDAKYARVMHYTLAGIFAIMIPVTLMTSLKDSLPFLIFLSLWALVAGHWSAGEAASAEMKIDKQDEREANGDTP